MGIVLLRYNAAITFKAVTQDHAPIENASAIQPA